MPDLRVQLGPVPLRNPVVTASGTFGYAREYSDLVPLDKIGAVTVKGVSPFRSDGNAPPRTAETFGGMLNAIGLQNPGIETFIRDPHYLPWLRTIDTAVFVNIWGRTVEDYVEVACRLEAEREGIAALEINISCPNIKEGGMSFGTDLHAAATVVSAVRAVTTLPLITKLSPNVSSIADFAKATVDAGTDIISLINTIPAMAIDVDTWRPKLSNVTGGLSGPAVKPVAVRMVREVAQAVDVPILGMGGICTAEDAVEFLLAGATAVAVGTAIFADPETPVHVVNGLDAYLSRHNLARVTDIIGKVRA